MTRERKWVLSLSVLLLLLVSGVSLLIFQPPLNKIHLAIEKDYASVSHISADKFSKLSSQLGSDQLVVFDVREPEEFEVSHIDGAIQVMPDIDPEEFIDDYGDLLEGKQVVFYCSVGRRSSELASRLGDAPFNHGAVSSLNLQGGVFTWVNEGRQLSNSTQQNTSEVHPYNDYWGRLVEDQSKLSYTPN